jgi:hypothetical protein
LNSAWEWTGSTFQVVAEVTSGAVAVVIFESSCHTDDRYNE